MTDRDQNPVATVVQPLFLPASLFWRLCKSPDGAGCQSWQSQGNWQDGAGRAGHNFSGL